MFGKWAVAGLLVAAFALPTSAQNLSLDQCLSLAKQNSPVLKQADLNLKSAGLARQEVGTTRLPQFRVSAGASYAPGSLDFGYDPALSNKGQFGSQLVMEQPLYDGGRRHIQMVQADLDISRMTAEQQLASRDLELEVRNAYIEILRAEQEVRLRRQGVHELEDYLQLVKSLSASGTVPYTDLLKTQVEASNASVTLSQSEQSLAAGRNQLSILLGNPLDSTTVLSDSLGELTPINLDTAALVLPLDTNRILELSTARLDYSRALTDISATKKEGLPTLSLVADAGWLTSRENLMLRSSDRYRSLGYSAGISLDMPLFDWGGRKLRVQQKQLAAESARLQSDQVRRAYESGYRNATLQLRAARSRLKIVGEMIARGRDNFLLTKSKYAASGASATDVLLAQQSLTDSRLAELDDLVAIQQAMAQLVRLAPM